MASCTKPKKSQRNIPAGPGVDVAIESTQRTVSPTTAVVIGAGVGDLGSDAVCDSSHAVRSLRCLGPEVVREDTGDFLVFLTNHHGLGASMISALYKDRWQLDPFFNALRKNFEVKTFVETPTNAVKIRIWTASDF